MPVDENYTTYRPCRALKAARTGTLRRASVRRGDVTAGMLVSRIPYAPVVTLRPTVAGRSEAMVPEWTVEWLEGA